MKREERLRVMWDVVATYVAGAIVIFVFYGGIGWWIYKAIN